MQTGQSAISAQTGHLLIAAWPSHLLSSFLSFSSRTLLCWPACQLLLLSCKRVPQDISLSLSLLPFILSSLTGLVRVLAQGSCASPSSEGWSSYVGGSWHSGAAIQISCGTGSCGRVCVLGHWRLPSVRSNGRGLGRGKDEASTVHLCGEGLGRRARVTARSRRRMQNQSSAPWASSVRLRLGSGDSGARQR